MLTKNNLGFLATSSADSLKSFYVSVWNSNGKLCRREDDLHSASKESNDKDDLVHLEVCLIVETLT